MKLGLLLYFVMECNAKVVPQSLLRDVQGAEHPTNFSVWSRAMFGEGHMCGPVECQSTTHVRPMGHDNRVCCLNKWCCYLPVSRCTMRGCELDHGRKSPKDMVGPKFSDHASERNPRGSGNVSTRDPESHSQEKVTRQQVVRCHPAFVTGVRTVKTHPTG
jgi:hypothetical protein